MISKKKIEEYVDKFIDRTYTDEDVDEVIYLIDNDIRFRERFVPIIYLELELEEVRLAILAEQNKRALAKLFEEHEKKKAEQSVKLKTNYTVKFLSYLPDTRQNFDWILHQINEFTLKLQNLFAPDRLELKGMMALGSEGVLSLPYVKISDIDDTNKVRKLFFTTILENYEGFRLVFDTGDVVEVKNLSEIDLGELSQKKIKEVEILISKND